MYLTLRTPIRSLIFPVFIALIAMSDIKVSFVKLGPLISLFLSIYIFRDFVLHKSSWFKVAFFSLTLLPAIGAFFLYSDLRGALYIIFNYSNALLCAAIFLYLLRRIPVTFWPYFSLSILFFLSIIGCSQLLLYGLRPPLIFYETGYFAFWYPFIFAIFILPLSSSLYSLSIERAQLNLILCFFLLSVVLLLICQGVVFLFAFLSAIVFLITPYVYRFFVNLFSLKLSYFRFLSFSLILFGSFYYLVIPNTGRLRSFIVGISSIGIDPLLATFLTLQAQSGSRSMQFFASYESFTNLSPMQFLFGGGESLDATSLGSLLANLTQNDLLFDVNLVYIDPFFLEDKVPGLGFFANLNQTGFLGLAAWLALLFFYVSRRPLSPLVYILTWSIFISFTVSANITYAFLFLQPFVLGEAYFNSKLKLSESFHQLGAHSAHQSLEH